MNRAQLIAAGAALLAGALPVVALATSAALLAQRWVFAGWGIGVALLYALLLRWGLASDWDGWVLAGRLLLLLAAAMALFARLLSEHFGEVDSGLRSLWPSLYRLALTRPQSAYDAAIGFAILGALAVLVGHGFGLRRKASR